MGSSARSSASRGSGRRSSSTDIDSQTKASSKYTVGTAEFHDEPEQYRPDRSSRDRPERCSPCFLCFSCGVAICLLVGGVAIAIVVLYMTDEGSPQPVGKCGECHCIPKGNASQCASNVPTTDYTDSMIESLRKQEPMNAVEMPPCDPYTDSSCKLGSALGDFGGGSVCGIHYENSFCSSYKLMTYASEKLAKDNGAFVTHQGACGVCSTTQDLAAYMRTVDLTTASHNCEVKAATDQAKGRQCFEDLGFSTDCAELWSNAAREKEKKCAFKCVVGIFRDTPFNSDAPSCTLNDCLQCKKDHTYSEFRHFAGRTSASSGLLSAIVRPCSEIANIQQLVCPSTKPLLN